MANGDLPQRQASYEHLFERGHHGTRGLRLGLLAAVTIHLGVFAITWPTLAETKPEFTPSPPRVCRLAQPVTFESSRPIIEVPQLNSLSRLWRSEHRPPRIRLTVRKDSNSLGREFRVSQPTEEQAAKRRHINSLGRQPQESTRQINVSREAATHTSWGVRNTKKVGEPSM